MPVIRQSAHAATEGGLAQGATCLISAAAAAGAAAAAAVLAETYGIP